MRVLRVIAAVILTLLLLLGLLVYGARYKDRPLGLLPGGPLQAGTLEPGAAADWSFARDEDTIELQLLSQDRSRTTWILVHDGAGFIPCSLNKKVPN